jgi:ABC-type branched-subunit amino acid transport system substrate-binding protein
MAAIIGKQGKPSPCSEREAWGALLTSSAATVRSYLSSLLILVALLLRPLDGSAQELKVGVIVGITGPAQVWADYSRKGLELGVSEHNGSPVVKRKLRLLFEDSKSTPASAVSAFRKLVHQDKVDIVVGDVWTFLTVPLISLAAREKVVLISPTVMDGSVPEANEYFFSLGHRFASLQTGLERFFKLNPSIGTAGVISFDDYWNKSA